MGSIFLSYSHADSAVARSIAEGLIAEGFDVWWDHALLAGSNYIVEINRRLRTADCVVVIWSETSIHSEWVLSEAGAARGRGILRPLRLGGVNIPAPFNSLHSLMLDVLRCEEAVQEACGHLARAIVEDDTPFAPARDNQSETGETFEGKRLLALDGCGARLPFQIGALKYIEILLQKTGRIRPDAPLSDYFDMIGGNSASAFLAALLSQGRSVSECADLVASFARDTEFGSVQRFRGANANNQRVRRAARKVFGAMRLDDPVFKAMWLAPTRRLDKPGAEVFSNNPSDPRWMTRSALDMQRYPINGLHVVDIIEAACAQMPFLTPVSHEFGPSNRGILVDASMFQPNPAAIMYDYAVSRDFGLNWLSGPKAISIVSVGGGILDRQFNAQAFLKQAPVLQAVQAILGGIEHSALETVVAFQERIDSPKPFFVRHSGGLIPGRAIARKRLARFQRVDSPLEYEYVRHAYGMQLRPEQWADTVAPAGGWDSVKFEALRAIGRQVAANAFSASAV